MKISDIKIYTLDAYRTNWAFVKVETDEGLYGWGEASLGTRENALEGCVEDMKPSILHGSHYLVLMVACEVSADITPFYRSENRKGCTLQDPS